MTSTMTGTALDATDAAILSGRIEALNEDQGPRVGDFVRFADGVLRRISHVWEEAWDDPTTASIQTSDGGHYYLGNGYVSMSGGLFPGVPGRTLTLTDETRDGSVWFFHHDQMRADNGVDVLVPFRVYACSLGANQ